MKNLRTFEVDKNKDWFSYNYEFEPKIGEVFKYQWGDKVDESVLLKCEKACRCSGCWIGVCITDLSSDTSMTFEELHDMYCVNCIAVGREDKESVHFIQA